jgi:NAD(P)H dehydrogenase (quinone)
MANEKIAVIYYSATGTTYKLARAIEEGARRAARKCVFAKSKNLRPKKR